MRAPDGAGCRALGSPCPPSLLHLRPRESGHREESGQDSKALCFLVARWHSAPAGPCPSHLLLQVRWGTLLWSHTFSLLVAQRGPQLPREPAGWTAGQGSWQEPRRRAYWESKWRVSWAPSPSPNGQPGVRRRSWGHHQEVLWLSGAKITHGRSPGVLEARGPSSGQAGSSLTVRVVWRWGLAGGRV